jgi:hypothetical protein
MFGGNLRWLEARVDGIEKILDRHMQECMEIARQNLARSGQVAERQEEMMRLQSENTAACIRTAETVRDDMQRTFLRAAWATIGVLIGAVSVLLGAIGVPFHLHGLGG